MECKVFMWSASLILCILCVTEARIEIRTIKQGNGVDVPQDNDTVVVHYTGSLVDGRVFDSSRVPGRTPFEFVIGKGTVINGWDIGFKHMSLGQRAQLIITYDDAYGSSGMMSSNPPIYPFATLIFDVELLQIKRPKQVPLNTFQSGFATGQQQQQQQQQVGFANQAQAGAAVQVPTGTGQFQNPGMTFGAQGGQNMQQAGQFGQMQPGQVGMQQLGTQQAAGQIQLGVPQQVAGQIQLGVQQQQQQQAGQLQSQPTGQFDAAQTSGQFGTVQTGGQFGTAQMTGQFQTAQAGGQQFAVQPGMQQAVGMQSSGQVAPQMRQPSSQQLGVQQGFGVQQGQAVGLQQG